MNEFTLHPLPINCQDKAVSIAISRYSITSSRYGTFKTFVYIKIVFYGQRMAKQHCWGNQNYEKSFHLKSSIFSNLLHWYWPCWITWYKLDHLAITIPSGISERDRIEITKIPFLNRWILMLRKASSRLQLKLS